MEVFHVLEIVVPIRIVTGERLLGGFTCGGEVEFTLGDGSARVFVRQRRGKLTLGFSHHVLNDGIGLHLVLEFGTKFKGGHLKHVQTLAHLWRQNL